MQGCLTPFIPYIHVKYLFSWLYINLNYVFKSLNLFFSQSDMNWRSLDLIN
jgi:hypothetical protein